MCSAVAVAEGASIANVAYVADSDVADFAVAQALQMSQTLKLPLHELTSAKPLLSLL